MFEKIINRLESIKKYIELNYMDENHSLSINNLKMERVNRDQDDINFEINEKFIIPNDYFDNNKRNTFTKKLLNLIDQKGHTDTEVYRKALIDRRHFSKIRSNPNYQPSKETVLSFILALELNVDQAIDLLQSAGFAFNKSNKSELIILYCIEEEIYDINEVNFALQSFNQPLLRD